MSYAIYVGRVGALAVALGIGIAVANTPMVAWAAPETGDDPSGISAQSPEQKDEGEVNTPDSGPLDGSDDSDNSDDSDDSDDPTEGMQVASSGGAITSTTTGSAGAKAADEDRDAAPPKRRLVAKSGSDSLQASSAPKKPKRSVLAAPAPPGLNAEPRSSALRVAPSDDQADQVVQPIRSVAEIAPQVQTAAVSPITASVVASPEPAPPTLMSRVLSLVTLTSAAGDAPPTPGEPPLLVGFLAGGRRVSQKASVEDESSLRTADIPETSLMLTMVADSAPAALTSAPPVPSVGVPNEDTGAVSGSLNGYTVTGQPASGTVAVNGDTFYIYTPTAAARLQAALTTQPDYDSFPVAMSGQPASTVTVPVLPAALSNQSSIPGPNQPVLTNPTGVAVNGTYAYVANQNANTVSVINTATGAVVKTITVGSQPSAVAISPTTGLGYVTNRASGTVSVINTATNAVVGSAIRVGSSPQDVAVNAAGTRVYVANYGSNNVSVIEPTNNNRVTTIPLGSGYSAPTAVALSADGSRAYVTHRNLSGGGVVVGDQHRHQYSHREG